MKGIIDRDGVKHPVPAGGGGVDPSIPEQLAEKADKVSPELEGHLAMYDEHGNLKDGGAPSQFAEAGHTHSGYAAADHTHSGYAAAGHTHTQAEVIGLQEALNNKANKNHTHANLSDALVALETRIAQLETAAGVKVIALTIPAGERQSNEVANVNWLLNGGGSMSLELKSDLAVTLQITGELYCTPAPDAPSGAGDLGDYYIEKSLTKGTAVTVNVDSELTAAYNAQGYAGQSAEGVDEINYVQAFSASPVAKDTVVLIYATAVTSS